MYHVVSDNDLMHIKNLYSVRSTQQFIQDIDYILKYYQPIDVGTLIDSVNHKCEIKRNSVLFTFDDGLREVYEIIAPILKQKGIPAVFFVNSDFIDNKNMFYRFKASLLVEEIKSGKIDNSQLREIAINLSCSHKSINEILKSILHVNYENKLVLDKIAEILNYSFNTFLKSNQPYLTSEQIKNIINMGFSVGAHSIDHPEYYKLSLNEQIKQTIDSVQYIKINFKQEHNLFAFPFTDYQVSKQFFETIYASVNPLINLSFGCAGIKDEFFNKHLQRIPIENWNETASKIVRKEYLAYLGKKIMGKNMIQRK